MSCVALPVCVAETLDLLRHHGEAAAGLAGARRLDGGVERQKIGLRGDARNEIHHVADAIGGGGEPQHFGAGAVGLGDGLTHHGGRTPPPGG